MVDNSYVPISVLKNGGYDVKQIYEQQVYISFLWKIYRFVKHLLKKYDSLFLMVDNSYGPISVLKNGGYIKHV